MKLYSISANGGNTWTVQWLRENEVEEHNVLGYIVKVANVLLTQNKED